MAGSTLVQLRVPDDLLARIDEACGESSRTAWLLGLATQQLDGLGEMHPAEATSAPVPAGPRSIGPGIPAPGVLCMWAACMSRDSDRCGVTDPSELTRRDYASQARDEDKCGLALCKAHAAVLEDRVHKAPRRNCRPRGASASLSLPSAGKLSLPRSAPAGPRPPR